MSAKPIGVSGQPSASAIGLGIAITSGVSMNGVPARGQLGSGALVDDRGPAGAGRRPDHGRLGR